MLAEKYQSFWPLPGGVESYAETLLRISKFVHDSTPSEETLTKWLLTFPNVTKEGNVRSYVNTVLLHSGLFARDRTGVRLTEDGEKYLEHPDNTFLFGVLEKNVVGFKAALQVIADNPCDIDTLHKRLVGELKGSGVHWTTAYGQPYWRASWLRSMGFVRLEGHEYILTDRGKELAQSLGRSTTTRTEARAQEMGEPLKQAEKTPIEGACASLKAAERKIDDPGIFEDAIRESFRLLGFEAEHLGSPGETDVLATAPLGPEAFSVVLDAKTTSHDKVTERQISWPSLEEHRDKHKANYIAAVGPDFAGGDLLERARKYKVLLIQTDTLVQLLRMHEKVAFNLEELKEIFDKTGLLLLDDCPQLVAAREDHERRVILVSKLMKKLPQLQKEGDSTTISDIYWALNKEFDKDEIQETLSFLEMLDAVKHREDGNYIAAMNLNILSAKLETFAVGR